MFRGSHLGNRVRRLLVPHTRKDRLMTFNLTQMRANRDAGTPGLWQVKESPFEVFNIGHGRLLNHLVAEYTMIAAFYADNIDDFDARRIAQVPDMEAEIERLTAENTRLRAKLGRAAEARDGAIREAATELEVNWGHIATPEMRDAILALASIKEKTK